MAIDSSGNLYVIDTGNSRIVKETLLPGYNYVQSVIPTTMTNPLWIAADNSGSVYLSNATNRNFTGDGIYKETPSGSGYTETKLLSGRSFAGIAVDKAGNLYAADEADAHFVKETLSGGSYTESLIADTSPYLQSDGEFLTAVAIDGVGKAYAMLSGENAEFVHVYVPSGNTYKPTSYGANSYFPNGMAVNAAGTAIYMINAFGNLASFSLNGNSTSIPVDVDTSRNSGGIAVDSAGNIYFTSTSGVIYRLSSDPLVLGTWPVGQTTLHGVINFLEASGTKVSSYVAVTQGSSNTDFNTVYAGIGDCLSNTGGNFQGCSVDVTLTPTSPGSRYGAVEVFDASGNLLATSYVNGTGVSPLVSFYPPKPASVGGGLSAPLGIAVDSAGNTYIADSGNNRVVKQGSASSTTIGTGLSAPSDVAIDGAGNVYIADTGNHQVLKETLQNASYVQSVVRSGLNTPTGVAVDGSGNVYIVDSGAVKVLKETLGTSGYTESTVAVRGLVAPADVAVDGLGNLYIADAKLAHAIKETYANGAYTQSNVAGGLVQPSGIAVDGVGDVFVADAGRNIVARVAYSGSAYVTQNTVVSGLKAPAGVAVDGHANLVVANSGANTVLTEDFADGPGFAFAPTPVGSASGYLTAQFWNLGNAPLHFPVPSTGSNPSVAANFTLNENKAGACPVVLASGTEESLNPGAYCYLQVQFTPTTTGPITGTVTVSDDALNGNATQTIGLKGTGTPKQN